ncbi:hypothetical protein AVEN_207020-1 [Araneus ventricosus]|uniref:Transposable element P transposase-like RNase H domain-containing protein n=1 Tax=Araneus ventricosus TaxID=182803 RepID=A0A4Y2GQG0_ARAVE|nr:hypothetical protein AVEN_207020-1 [Araneus ventricosus]
MFDSKAGKIVTAPLKYPRLVSGAIPSQMPNCASYISSSTFSWENPEVKKMKLEQLNIERALQESMIEKRKYDECRDFKNLEELNQRISLVNMTNFWNIMHKENKILFVNLELNPAPEIALSVVIKDSLDMSVFVGKTSLSNIPNITSLPTKVNNINNLNEILEQLPEMKKNNKLLNSDIISQVHSFMDSLRYPNTLKNKTVILQIDEMHIKPYFDYKGGNISGLCFNSENAATSVMTFMISSILSSYKDVVHILPISKITADALHTFIKQIVVGLDGIGFKVICVITDNNSINQKAMSQFVSPSHSYSIVYPHPVDDKRPLFSMIDTVHLLKNIRNNWINQKYSDKCMFYPKFMETISEKSSKDCIKNVEDNNDNIIDSVDNIIDGCNSLMKQGEKFQFPNYKETAEYIKIINRWWDIVNVKTPFIGIHENNVYKKPLTSSETDERYKFLDGFLNWLEDWKNMGCKTGMLTKETHSALYMTTFALKEITKYCEEEFNMKYIRPGKFQTDNLEARFVLYRQMAGA